jgi:hypothetical protein
VGGGRGNKFAQRKANKKNVQSQIKEGKQRKIFTFKISQQIPTQPDGQKICAS